MLDGQSIGGERESCLATRKTTPAQDVGGSVRGEAGDHRHRSSLDEPRRDHAAARGNWAGVASRGIERLIQRPASKPFDDRAGSSEVKFAFLQR